MIAVWQSSGIKTTWLCLSTDTGLGGKNTMLYMFCIWQKLNTFCSYTNINVDFWFQKGHEQSPWEKGCICLTHWLDWIRRNMLTVRGLGLGSVVVVNAWMDMKFFMGICVTTDIKKKDIFNCLHIVINTVHVCWRKQNRRLVKFSSGSG